MAVILIIAVIILVVFLMLVFSDSNNNVKSHIKKLKNLPLEKLESILSSLVLKMILHDESVKRVGKAQADRVCKYEEYGCKNYAEVKMFHDAVVAEIDKRKNNR